MRNWKSSLLSLALVSASQPALAQSLLGAGGAIQQIPQPPPPQQAPPSLTIQRSEAPAGPAAAGPKFVVTALHVTGETRFSEAELIAATGFTPGSELSLSDLRELASRITDLYNRKGYFVAQAYLPPQDIKGGVVTIAVIEGRYGKISLDNKTRVSDRVFNDILDGLNPGDAVVADPLERRLLIISDIPGVETSSTLAPGSDVGTTDLTVGVTPGPRVTGSIEADNAGNPYTGTYRLGASADLNEPFGIGDVLGARIFASTTGGLEYGRVFYEAQVEDARVGVAYTQFFYRLGRQFTPLDATGSEEIGSIYGSYPIIRSYDNNLYALADFDARTFQDKIGATNTVTDKQAYALTAGLSGDHHDMFWGGGSDSFLLTWTFGDLDIQSAPALAQDALTARTNGSYGKLYLSASRLQHVVGPFSLYGLFRGQLASKNLDISEKMELGGAYGVRAYPEGESYGDDGYIATLEGRYALPKWKERLPGDLTAIAFVDTGAVRLNHSPWFVGPNSESRSGAGVGLVWDAPNNFEASVTYSFRLSSHATSAPDHFGGLWVQLVKYF